jgi:DEAD/DEAH box helicase
VAVTLSEAGRLLAATSLDDSDVAFQVLASIAHHGAFEDRDEARHLLIRVLDRRDELAASLQDMLHALVREHGLFPYIRDALGLPVADQLALEVHRPYPALSDDFVFHSQQAIVYEHLLAGENVVLSAPTSFGKSLIIDAVLAARDFRNAAVVVPTIALMDECRRRLARLNNAYKIITHGTQRPADRNLYVMTQERLLEIRTLPPLDFFAIDEFYKLDPTHSDERSNQLNIVFRQLLSTGAQFYLLGPSITRLTDNTVANLRATFIETGFTTVVTDVERLNVNNDELPDVLAETCREVGPETLIFCKSPNRIREVAPWLMDRGIGGGRNLDDAANWIAEAYHPDWLVGRALRQGIGIHHGRLPRALGHHIVRLFNEGRLPYLLVTSTLIEGVNTTARNVLVLDNKIANKKYDYFTFSNIRGRSGRMSRHYVGRVVVFNPTPQPADMTVNIPSLSQSPKVSDQILLQLPDGELTERSRRQLAPYYEQDVVSIDTLRHNKGLAPERQLQAAKQLAAEPARLAAALNWRGAYPTSDQVKDLGGLLFTLTGGHGAVRTAAQLSARVNMLRFHRGDLRALVRQQIDRGAKVDDAVEDELDFARNWAQFKIPTALAGASVLAADVLGKTGRSISDTTIFAGALENLFLPPFTTVLEEYGLPTSLTVKLSFALHLEQARSLDDILARVQSLAVLPATLGPFEQEMLADTRRAL